jgi:hypothetical protein
MCDGKSLKGRTMSRVLFAVFLVSSMVVYATSSSSEVGEIKSISNMELPPAAVPLYDQKAQNEGTRVTAILVWFPPISTEKTLLKSQSVLAGLFRWEVTTRNLYKRNLHLLWLPIEETRPDHLPLGYQKEWTPDPELWEGGKFVVQRFELWKGIRTDDSSEVEVGIDPVGPQQSIGDEASVTEYFVSEFGERTSPTPEPSAATAPATIRWLAWVVAFLSGLVFVTIQAKEFVVRRFGSRFRGSIHPV